jgi:hypothetical protein
MVQNWVDVVTYPCWEVPHLKHYEKGPDPVRARDCVGAFISLIICCSEPVLGPFVILVCQMVTALMLETLYLMAGRDDYFLHQNDSQVVFFTCILSLAYSD